MQKHEAPPLLKSMPPAFSNRQADLEKARVIRGLIQRISVFKTKSPELVCLLDELKARIGELPWHDGRLKSNYRDIPWTALQHFAVIIQQAQYAAFHETALSLFLEDDVHELLKRLDDIIQREQAIIDLKSRETTPEDDDHEAVTYLQKFSYTGSQALEPSGVVNVRMLTSFIHTNEVMTGLHHHFEELALLQLDKRSGKEAFLYKIMRIAEAIKSINPAFFGTELAPILANLKSVRNNLRHLESPAKLDNLAVLLSGETTPCTLTAAHSELMRSTPALIQAAKSFIQGFEATTATFQEQSLDKYTLWEMLPEVPNARYPEYDPDPLTPVKTVQVLKTYQDCAAKQPDKLAPSHLHFFKSFIRGRCCSTNKKQNAKSNSKKSFL